MIRRNARCSPGNCGDRRIRAEPNAVVGLFAQLAPSDRDLSCLGFASGSFAQERRSGNRVLSGFAPASDIFRLPHTPRGRYRRSRHSRRADRCSPNPSSCAARRGSQNVGRPPPAVDCDQLHARHDSGLIRRLERDHVDDRPIVLEQQPERRGQILRLILRLDRLLTVAALRAVGQLPTAAPSGRRAAAQHRPATRARRRNPASRARPLR